MLKTTIYLDNAATTKVSDNVLNAMLPYLKAVSYTHLTLPTNREV